MVGGAVIAHEKDDGAVLLARIFKATQYFADMMIGQLAVSEILGPVFSAGGRVRQERRRFDGVDINADVHLVAVAKGAVRLRDIGKVKERSTIFSGARELLPHRFVCGWPLDEMIVRKFGNGMDVQL